MLLLSTTVFSINLKSISVITTIYCYLLILVSVLWEGIYMKCRFYYWEKCEKEVNSRWYRKWIRYSAWRWRWRRPHTFRSNELIITLWVFFWTELSTSREKKSCIIICKDFKSPTPATLRTFLSHQPKFHTSQQPQSTLMTTMLSSIAQQLCGMYGHM